MSSITKKDPVNTRGEKKQKPFLTAHWEHLIMANYCVDPMVLQSAIPAGTELDFFQGQALCSVVGFLFRDTRIHGLSIPGYRDFEEVNLRFYVRKQTPEGWRRGVVFIRELVGKRAIATVARWLYREPYLCVPIAHSLTPSTDDQSQPGLIRYEWQYDNQKNMLQATFSGNPEPHTPESEAAFIAEHYWGYTAYSALKVGEYQVEHPPWRIWNAASHTLSFPSAEKLWGRKIATCLQKPPTSVFIAEGSAVSVYPGKWLKKT